MTTYQKGLPIMNKQELRKQIFSLRRKIPMETIKNHSQQIHNHLFNTSEYQQAPSICFYVSYGHEVQTHEMIKQALTQGKTIIVPCCNTIDHTLILSRITSWKQLQPGTYGILEIPEEQRKTIQPHTLDLIIVPGVAFDNKGNRLGQGGGYYDRLLASAQGKTIGLCFETQLIEQVPISTHDKPVDMIITEKQVIHCST